LYNYNHELEYFWDIGGKFMQEEFQNYSDKKDTILRLNEGTDLKIRELDKEFRAFIISKMGKNKSDIENEHFKLSKAFGFYVGVTKTLSEQTQIILNPLFEISLNLINKFNEKKADFIPNQYLENFLVLFNVFSNNYQKI